MTATAKKLEFETINNLIRFPNNFKIQNALRIWKYKFELENAEVKKTALLSYKCKYWLIIKCIYFKITYQLAAMKQWTTETLNHLKLKNTMIANWFDKFEPNWIWDMSYNAKCILTVKLNTIEQVLKIFHLNLMIDEVLLLWVCHLAFSVSYVWKTSYLF